MVFLVSLCIWHAIIGSQSDIFYYAQEKNPNFRTDLDKIVLYVIAGCYLTFHLVYILFFLFKFSRYSKLEIEEPEQEKADPKKETQEIEPEPELFLGFSQQPLDINSDAYFERQKSILESRSTIATLAALSANHIKPSVRTSSVKPSDNFATQFQLHQFQEHKRNGGSSTSNHHHHHHHHHRPHHNQDHHDRQAQQEISRVSNPFAQPRNTFTR